MSQGKIDREQRLAEALRANLRRRKGQARERDETGEPEGGSGISAPAEVIPADKN